jgi:hypothetical protein
MVGSPMGSAMGYGRATGLGFTPRPSNREWLPVPAVEFKRAEIRPRAHSRWPRIPASGGVEDKAIGLLMLLAVTAVAYGFWALVQFVENWAGFQAGVSRFVE